MPYALIDRSRSGPEGLVVQGHAGLTRQLDQTGAATTRFKLADGGKSAAPAGQITLDLTMGGQLVRGSQAYPPSNRSQQEK